MIITITLILSFLVALNFLLLIFSCNRHSKVKKLSEKGILSKPKEISVPTKELATAQLAPTGS
jgi:hypothetical protein